MMGNNQVSATGYGLGDDFLVQSSDTNTPVTSAFRSPTSSPGLSPDFHRMAVPTSNFAMTSRTRGVDWLAAQM